MRRQMATLGNTVVPQFEIVSHKPRELIMNRPDSYPTEDDIRDRRLLDLGCETGDIWDAIASLKRQIAGQRNLATPGEGDTKP